MDINVLGLAVPTFTTTVQGCLQTWVSMRLLKDTGKKIKLMRAHCSYTIRKLKLQGNKVLCFSMMAYNIYGREYFTILIDGGDSMMLK